MKLQTGHFSGEGREHGLQWSALAMKAEKDTCPTSQPCGERERWGRGADPLKRLKEKQCHQVSI